jgi:branched-chain amino acid transport system substrate-binding protein
MPERYSAWIRNSICIACIAIMALVGLSACGGQSTPDFQNQKPIKIGFSYSTSSDFSMDGPATKQGYQLWADTINKNGGLLGRPVQLVAIPDNSDPAKVAANYQQLITVDHVDLVFGPFSTLLTKPASVVANKYGYALVEGSGGGPSVFNRGLNNIFDVSLPVANNLVTFAYYILSLPQDERPKTAAYATEDDPFTQPQVDLARQLLENGGVKTVYYHVYPAATTKDYTPFANAVVTSGAQVVILGTLLPDLTAFIKTFRQQRYNPVSLIATAGPDAGTDFIKAVGLKSTEGVFVPNGWYPEATNFQNAQMVQDYLAQYGGSANAINADIAEAYAVGQVVQQAVTKIGSINNAALIRELHSGDTFNSVQGAVRFDPATQAGLSGQNTLALSYLFQWQHGTFIPVYPSFAAAENPEFPRPQWS